VLVRIPQGVCHSDEFVSALQLMAEKDVGALIVLEGSKLVEIFSERDYARKVRLAGKTSTDTPVSKIMAEKVVSVTPDRTVPECVQLMTDKWIRHLPVMEGGRVIGMLSIGDIVKEMLSHHERLLKQLAMERVTLLTPDHSSY
jgi:signal-transduction protein with cAMP-binding, CBS, and nucleotidyltransferase domain